jgi:hypothetical protein
MDKQYKSIRKEKLLERETSMIPDTLEYVDSFLEDKRIKVEIKKAQQKLIEDKILIGTLEAQRITCTDNEESFGLFQYINQKRQDLLICHETLESLKHDLEVVNSEISLGSSNKVLDKYKFKCNKNFCRGFIIHPVPYCKICKVDYCLTCENEVVLGHICKESDIETIKLLRSDSKPCPKCFTLIHKISGCSDMWCVNCKTPFNFHTGEIRHANFHNPHQEEYIRRQTRNRASSERLVDGRVNYCNILREKTRLEVINIIVKLKLENQGVILEIVKNFPNTLICNIIDHKTDRLRYMTNELTSEKFCDILLRTEQRFIINSEINGIYEMYINVLSDILGDLIYTRNEELFKNEYDSLENFTQESINNLCSVFKIKNNYAIKSAQGP